MLIKSDFEVPHSVDKVWAFFNDIPQVAKCLPGTELTGDLGNDKYQGKVAIRMGPVKLQFGGTAQIKERDAAAKRLVVDAAGADEAGRGQAALLLTATLATTPRGGTKVDTSMDLQLSGAAAQFGRGMVADVTAVLLRDFGTNLQARVDAISRGLNPDQVGTAKAASGFAIGLRAARMALARVFRRFFLPYEPSRV
ncbi:MAG TPA: SRPBCC family protein [Jiangellales bacterium]|nr:SRPBCC family protein [Jiangellales bacterium]